MQRARIVAPFVAPAPAASMPPSRRRALVQFARVVALSGALAALGTIVVSDVIAAERASGSASVPASLDAEPDALDDVFASPGPLAYTSAVSTPLQPPILAQLQPLAEVMAPASEPTPVTKPRKKRRRKRSPFFKFGRMDAY